jgi:hypothetical protein
VVCQGASGAWGWNGRCRHWTDLTLLGRDWGNDWAAAMQSEESLGTRLLGVGLADVKSAVRYVCI